MNKYLSAAFALTLLLVPALSLGAVDAYGSTWKQLAIGPGGWLDGMDIAPDGTRVVRTDTYGGYIWNGSGWQQLVTNTSMPAPYNAADYNEGIFELRIAPSNTNRLYMTYLGYVFRSDNRGATWTKTALAKISAAPDSNERMWGDKMAVDPINPDIVYAGSEGSGLYVTSNAGSSWTKVSAIPNGSGAGITGIAFDPSSGATGGKTNVIYVGVNGTGVYRSADAGATWTKTSSGPTAIHHAVVGSNGSYWAADGSSGWRYASGVWTKLTTGGCQGGGAHAVAVDPANASHVVFIDDGGSIDVTTNGGTSWSGWGCNFSRVATDVPWLAWTNESYMSAGDIAFDPTASNKLYFSEGIGAWYTTPPSTNTSYVWTSQNLGIGQLVGTDVIVPPGGKPVVTAWDRPVFYSANPDVFPSTHGPNNNIAIMAGWDADWASSQSTYVAALMNWGSTDESAFSTNGGQTWTQFSAKPALSGHNSGGIAVATPSNIVIAQNNNGKVYVTTNGGSTWTSPASLPTSGWGFSMYTNRHIVAADRVNIGTFYAYNYSSGLYRSTDGGATWSLIKSGELVPFSSYNAELKTVPGKAGNLFYTNGQSGVRGDVNPDKSDTFVRSTDGGQTWTTIPNVYEVYDFGFGAPAQSGGYPSIYVAGWVGNTYGIWRSDDNASTWKQVGDWPLGSLDMVTAVEGDMSIYGRVYLALNGSSYVYGDTAGGTSALPPTVSLLVNPTSITTGQSATLSWSSTNATSCTGSGFAAGATSGSATVSPAQTTTYSITCTGAGGVASQSATVTVVPVAPVPTASISASPSSIIAGQSGGLGWSSTNAISCTASGGWSGTKATTGSQVINPTVTTLYTIVCSGTGGTSNPASVTVTVTAPAPVATLVASPSSITAGQTATLTWSSTNATSCTGSGFSTGNATLGSVGVTPSVTTTYTITCSGTGGTSNPASATVTVSPANSVPTATLSSNPTSIASGQSSTLTWTSTNATSCTGVGFSAGTTAGTATVSPSVTTTYSITCTGAGGTSAPAPATVTVSIVGNTFSIGSRVQTTDSLSVRNKPNTTKSSKVLCTQPIGAQGTITSGPQIASGFTWWNINYDTACDGWSADTYLALANSTPAPVATLSASPASITSGQSATLTWSSSNATTCSGTNFSTAGATSGSVSVSPSTTTTYSISCTGAGGTIGSSATVTVNAIGGDTTPPSIPGGLGASAVSSTQINLTWSASSDAVGVAGYTVYRNGTQIATVSGTSYSDTALTANTAYSYTVAAFDAAGNASGQSASVSATTQGTVGGSTAPVWTVTATPASQYLAYGTNVATFSAVSIGAPAANRLVVVGIGVEGSYQSAPSAVTIGGVAATKATATSAGSGLTASLWYALVPSGTSADVVVKQSTSCCTINNMGIIVGTLTSVATAPSATGLKSFAYTADPQKVIVSVPTNGVGVGMFFGMTQNPLSWSNAIGDATTQTAGTGITVSMAHTTTAGSQTLSALSGDYGGAAMAAASWGPSLAVLPQAQTAAVNLTHPLARGWAGPEVSLLQSLLTKLGLFPGEVTGYFGPVTEQAVLTLQQQHNLSAVGIVGPITRAILNNLGN